MSTLFISHSSRDNAAAEELQGRLEAQGHRSVFLDLDPEKGIQAGVSWERTLYTKLRACRAVVALCSDSYLASQWCFAEIALARMEGKELFVLQIDPWSEQTQMPSILTEEQFIDLRTNKDDGYQRLWNGFKVKGIVPAEAREWKVDEPPYPGLRAFREEDAPIFFGREEEIREGGELLSRVRRQGHPRLVMVLGSSGSGKSSLVRAGIVPQLRRDRGQWLVVQPFRPGREPFRALAVTLSRSFDEAGQALAWDEIHRSLEPEAGDELASPAVQSPATAEGAEPSPAEVRQRLLQALSAMEGQLTAADDNVTSSVRRLKEYLDQQQTDAPRASGGAPLPSVADPLAEFADRLRLHGQYPEATVVLVIDQFEELLGHDGEHPASRFLAMLRAAIEAEDSPLLVIGTMRSDYLGALQRCVPLRGLGFKSLSVGPMSRDGMRQIIEEPAKLGQIQLENGLSDLLLEDTETSDALPLLAFTLRMMWDRYHDDRLLEKREYREFGRLQGAIAQVADETFEDALEQVQHDAARDALADELRDAFLSMARPAAEGSGWSRQPVSWDQLSEEVRPVLLPFIDPQRLLVKREDGTVEVAHEALFRSWDRLKGWLDENAEGLHLLREIQVEAKKWDAAGTEEDKEPYLFRGGRLARALELRVGGVLPLKDLARSFVDASERAERARVEAEEARRRQRLRRARQLAVIMGSAAVITLIFGLWAWHLKVEANRNLVRARDALRISVVRQLWSDPTTTHTRVALLREVEAADPTTVRGWTDLRLRVLKEPVTEAILRSPEESRTVMSAAFSHDGKRLFTAYEVGTACLWKADSPDAPIELPGHENSGSVSTATFSGDGRLFFTGYDDGTGKLWDAVEPGAPLSLPAHEGSKKVTAAAFRFDAKRIVVSYADGTAWVWNSKGSNEPGLPLPGHKDSGAILAVAFTPNGEHIVAVYKDGAAGVWDAAGAVVRSIPSAFDNGVSAAAFSPDAARVVTAAEGESARVSSLDGSDEMFDLAGTTDSTDRALFATFSPDGKQIAAGFVDGKVRVWSADGPELREFPGHDAPISTVAFSHDSQRIVTACGDGTGRVWNVDGSGEPIVLRGHTAYLRSASFSPDGRHIVTASEDGTARVWNLESWGEPIVLPKFTAHIRAAVFSLDGERILTAHVDGSARETRADRSREPIEIRGKTEWAESAAFGANGGQSVTVYGDGTVRLWKSDGGGEVIPLSKREQSVYSSALSADGTRIVIGYDDGMARVWDIGHPARHRFELLTPEAADSAVNAAAFGSDGDRLVTGYEDGTVRVWKVGRGSAEFWVRLSKYQGKPVSATALNKEGTRIVIGHADGVARLLELNANGSHELMLELHGFGESVSAVAFSPDGNRILVAYDDEVRVWELSDLAPLWLRTRVCLTAEERQALLSQDPETAKSDFMRCREMVRCLQEAGPKGFNDCCQKLRPPLRPSPP